MLSNKFCYFLFLIKLKARKKFIWRWRVRTILRKNRPHLFLTHNTKQINSLKMPVNNNLIHFVPT